MEDIFGLLLSMLLTQFTSDVATFETHALGYKTILPSCTITKDLKMKLYFPTLSLYLLFF